MRNGFLAGAIVLALPFCGLMAVFGQQDRMANPNIQAPSTVAPNRVAPSNIPANSTDPLYNNNNPNNRESIPAWNNSGQPQTQPQTQLARQPGNVLNGYASNPNSNPTANPQVMNPAGGIPEGYVRVPNPNNQVNPNNPGPNVGNPGNQAQNIRQVSNQPQVPFQLTPDEERTLDNFLQVWEQHSSKIKYFSTQFDCKKYVAAQQGAQTPAGSHVLKQTQYGDFQYEAPNKLLFRMAGEWVDEKQLEYKGKDEHKAERFLCDGTAYYRFESTQKKVEKIPLPKEMLQAGAISGPLPFIFGAKANEMKSRYFLRLVTPDNLQSEQVWLEARPKWADDAAEFYSITMILDRKTFIPKAMRKVQNNSVKDYDVFVFVEPKANATGQPSSGPFANLFGNNDPFNYTTHSRGFTLHVNDTFMNNPQMAGPNQPGPGFSPPPVGPNQEPVSVQANNPNNPNTRPPAEYPRQPDTGRINLYDNTGNNSGSRGTNPIR